MSQMELPQPQLVWQNRAAQHRSAVYLCADDRYAPYALFLAHQIATANPSRDFDICIVSDQTISAHPLHDVLDLRLVQIDIAALEAHALVGERIGFATYLRIFMPRLWQAEYDRLLYLDGDIFYQRGDISALLHIDLRGHALAAVLDTKQWHKPRRAAKDITALGLPASPYFNGGVLLIDVPAFNAARCGERALELIFARGKELVWHDQTALNAILLDAWVELPVQWNYQYSHKTMLWAGHFDVCFFHFIGRRKPFYAKYGGFSRRFTSVYHTFLAAHFPPVAPLVQDGAGGPARWGALVWIVLFNLPMLRGALRMEARADGDFDLRWPHQNHL